MKAYVGAAIVLLVLAGVSLYGAAHETLEQLIARAETVPEGQRSDLYLEIAGMEAKNAGTAYAAGKADEGQSALQQTVDYAGKAHALVLKSGKKLPHTEIKIRRLAAQLRDLKQNVDAEDQPAVQSAVDKLEAFRTELLKGMFGAKGAEKP